ncbi:FitA-like ribbon-helix-helix domain-containing protein [Cyanobium sp. ATX 6F1]|uniref:FitA-like ribbon-helix-helix domain-containing protein n=1 Tax=unclassified Cyanobium TaxID=2627006 RepID=UPI0020CF3B23|nr:plasmid stabilization protein [Cyanobium sp. ATX 6F1]MCP9917510.1 plasmid stabilization protein [Cyanobium sp. ATX 6F1]
MAQLLVRNLDPAVKEALRRRARRHGRSMEEEARLILRQVIDQEPLSEDQRGPGTRMVALFAEAELDQPIGEWRGQEATPARFVG